MTDRPIIFSGPMVRALLEGRKTQSRRLATSPLARCAPGDRLWVREAWARVGDNTDDIHGCPDLRVHVYYRADTLDTCLRWRPSIHMPRWASRLTLHVADVRLQKLQAISEDDAWAEGVPRCTMDDECRFYADIVRGTHRTGFAGTWAHLHGAGSWDANPEVVVLTFRVQHENIDAGAVPTPRAVLERPR